MIRHYDMATGELIGDPGSGHAKKLPERPEPQPATRLMTVQEAIELERSQHRGMPADMLTTDPGTF